MRATQLHYESGKNYDVIDFIKDYKLNFNKTQANQRRARIALNS